MAPVRHREGGDLVSVVAADGSSRLFFFFSGELFELVWDTTGADELRMRAVRIFTGGLDCAPYLVFAAGPIGLVLCPRSNKKTTACKIIRVPAPLVSFDSDAVAAFATSAEFTALSWVDLGWADEPSHSMIWNHSRQSLLTFSTEHSNSRGWGRPASDNSDQEFVKSDYNCSKCSKWSMGGQGWKSNKSEDYALCANCFETLDTDTKINLAGEMEACDFDELKKKSIIPFVLSTGPTIISSLALADIEAKHWTKLAASPAPLPVKAYVPRPPAQPSFPSLQVKPISLALSRGGMSVEPPEAPHALSVVAAWQPKPNVVPASHLAPDFKKYDSLLELLSSNLGSLLFICTKKSFGGAGETVTLRSFLDFDQRYAINPTSIWTESCQTGSYSQNSTELSSILWVGVADYVPECLNNPDRESFLLDLSGFGF